MQVPDPALVSPAARGPLVPDVFRIAEVERDTLDTVTLALTPVQLGTRLQFAPGQFNMLYAFGAGEVPISISGDPGATDQFVHTIRAVGAATQALCRLAPGQMVGVRGPFGSAWPLDAARQRDVVLVAGGIGMAPLRSAVYDLIEHRDRYGQIALLYGARSPGDILYAKQLQRWRQAHDIAIHVTVDRTAEGWHGPVGVVTGFIDAARFDAQRTVAMICGPEIMARFAVRELLRRHVAEENIYIAMERNMKCAIGFCGHCQFGPEFVCKDGSVFQLTRIKRWFGRAEI